ncbi:hypothetical protein RvVAR0630_34050 [Agrobacterium vitis]|nr:hypothetical protein RvVAR0630_34050 [Agrobacterium vitis]
MGPHQMSMVIQPATFDKGMHICRSSCGSSPSAKNFCAASGEHSHRGNSGYIWILSQIPTASMPNRSGAVLMPHRFALTHFHKRNK